MDAGTTADIVERDRRHVFHPYEVFDTKSTDDVLPITRGAGARIVDSDVRGSHLMACVEFIEDCETRRHYPEALDVGKLVADACEPRGLIVRPMVHLNVMSPPLVIDRDDVDHIVSTLRDAIVQVRVELDRRPAARR